MSVQQATAQAKLKATAQAKLKATAQAKLKATAQAKLKATAQAKLKSLTTEILCQCYEETNGNHGSEVSTVRGWIMDELEQRNTHAFGVWMDCEDPEKAERPTLFFKPVLAQL